MEFFFPANIVFFGRNGRDGKQVESHRRRIQDQERDRLHKRRDDCHIRFDLHTAVMTDNELKHLTACLLPKRHDGHLEYCFFSTILQQLLLL